MHAGLPAHTETSLDITLSIGGGSIRGAGMLIHKAVAPKGVVFRGRLRIGTRAARRIGFSGHCFPRLYVSRPHL